MTALFTINEIGYNTNEKGNRFFKIENEKTTRIGKAEYEAAYEQYMEAAQVEMEEEEMAEEIKMEAEAQEMAQEEKKTKKSNRSLKKAARIVKIDDREIGLTEKHLMFLTNLPKCDFWDDGLASNIWVFDVKDTLEMAGMAGMTVGAMISTLREKGLLVVGEDQWTADKNGRRARREKYIHLTDLGQAVAEAIGVQ